MPAPPSWSNRVLLTINSIGPSTRTPQDMLAIVQSSIRNELPAVTWMP